ncbi:MAG: hypothetical protein AABW50_01090 [Nanoarchaeota archaeon]
MNDVSLYGPHGTKIPSIEGRVSHVSIYDNYPVTEVWLDNQSDVYSLNAVVESFRPGDKIKLYIPKPDNHPKDVIAFEIFKEDSDVAWMRRILPSLEKHPDYKFESMTL